MIVVAIAFIIIGDIIKGDEDDYDYTYHDDSYSQPSHDCYVCGEDGNIFYGSHYYCPTHYAWVKTVVENS